MNKKKIISVSLFVLVTVFLIIFIYFCSGMYIRSSLNYQMNSILKNHNTTKMKKLSANSSTLLFLKETSSNTNVKNTSDAQGGSTKELYYVTNINRKSVGVYMKKTGFLTWRIKKIIK